jgi:hypothetical protein
MMFENSQEMISYCADPDDRRNLIAFSDFLKIRRAYRGVLNDPSATDDAKATAQADYRRAVDQLSRVD